MQSLANATLHAGVDQAPGVRVGRPGGELDAGQKRRGRAARRERVDVRVVEVGAVVDRGQAQLAGKPHPRAGPELVGVEPSTKAFRLACLENRARLGFVERAALAEHVDPLRVLGAGVEHRPGHQVDVPTGVVGVLRRHHVRAEERRLVGDLPRDRQAARLVEDGEAVAALDLERRGALAPHLGGQPDEVGGELLVASPLGWRRRWCGCRRRSTAVPVIRAANSSARSPANTRWLCESTKPGTTARPPTS